MKSKPSWAGAVVGAVLCAGTALADPPFAEGGTHGADPDPKVTACIDESGTVEQGLDVREVSPTRGCSSPPAALGALVLCAALALRSRR